MRKESDSLLTVPAFRGINPRLCRNDSPFLGRARPTPLAVIVPFLQLEFVPLIGRGLLCNREYKRRRSRGGQKTSRNNAGRRRDDDKERAAKKSESMARGAEVT